MKPLKGKTALVTGGGQGLGQAICMKLAKKGIQVAVADINHENSVKLSRALKEKYGVKSIALAVDVTDEWEVEKAFSKTVQEFGRLDILVNNAGIVIAYEITEFPADDFRKIMEINFIGYFLCAREAAKIMKKQGEGVIIQINSKSGKKGSFKNSAYAASKFAGIGFTQSIALDLAPYNIRVHAICPGNLLDSPLWVDSLYEQYSKKWGITKKKVKDKYIDQVPLKRGCTYNDVIEVLLFLISDKASYMTGQAINVTGGQEMR